MTKFNFVGINAPLSEERVVLKALTPMWGEVKPVSWGAKLPNSSLTKEEWRWEAHTPSVFRAKRENSKKWRRGHGKRAKQLAKRQGLCR